MPPRHGLGAVAARRHARRNSVAAIGSPEELASKRVWACCHVRQPRNQSRTQDEVGKTLLEEVRCQAQSQNKALPDLQPCAQSARRSLSQMRDYGRKAAASNLPSPQLVVLPVFVVVAPRPVALPAARPNVQCLGAALLSVEGRCGLGGHALVFSASPLSSEPPAGAGALRAPPCNP